MSVKTQDHNLIEVQPNRYYAFDYLKTAMMMAVVLLHSATTYMVMSLGKIWPAKDPNTTNLIFDVIVAYLDCISMPIFFVISGFLTAMLVKKRGEKQMLGNRLNRIFYPFLIGIIILAPLSSFTSYYFELTVAGIDNPIQLAFSKILEDGFGLLNFKFWHLWFLYCLFLFCLVGATISFFGKKNLPKVPSVINRVFSFVYQLRLAPFLWAIPTCLLLCLRHKNFIETPANFNTNIIVLVSYAIFFFFGWLTFNQNNIARFKKWDIAFGLLGIIFFATKLIVYSTWGDNSNTEYILAATNAIFIWLSIFAFIGLFLRYFDKYSRLVIYLSDASYWIYLIHLPMVLTMQTLLIHLPTNAFVKFSIVVASTFLITIITYNYLVRNTFLGSFLNGRRYERGLPKKEVIG